MSVRRPIRSRKDFFNDKTFLFNHLFGVSTALPRLLSFRPKYLNFSGSLFEKKSILFAYVQSRVSEKYDWPKQVLKVSFIPFYAFFLGGGGA